MSAYPKMKLFAIAILVASVLTIHNLRAQELCEVLAREVWEEVTNNCDNTDPDNACYGNDSLVATFIDAEQVAAFERPGDLIELLKLHTAHTLPFDESEEEWGIGQFLIPAASFGGSTEDPVIIMMAGDVAVENASDSADEAPMQNFNFQTGGASGCREAPNAVFIQSPKDIKVDLVINSTPIRLGSTIVMGTNVDEQGRAVMWFGVLEGTLTLYPDTPKAKVVREGNFTTTVLSDQQGRNIDGEVILENGLVAVLNRQTGEQVTGVYNLPFYRQVPVTDFAEPQPITFDGSDFTGWNAYQFVKLIPQTLLNYTVVIPETGAQTASSGSGASSSKPFVRPTFTPTGSPVENWCYAGGAWADSCNHSDPAISAWYWNAGWYYAAYAAGKIASIPPEYRNAPTSVAPSSTPMPTVPGQPTNTPTMVTATITPSETVPGLPTVIVPTSTPTNNVPTLEPTLPPTLTPTFTATPAIVCVDMSAMTGTVTSAFIDPSIDAQNVEIHDDTTCTSPLGINFALVIAPTIAEAQQLCVNNFALATATDYTAAYPNLYRCTVN